MAWEVEYTDEFHAWFQSLDERQQVALASSIELLQAEGPSLARPYADTVTGSRFPNMKELRTQAGGRPLRTFYAFDPRRTGILLIGGDKTGDARFYERTIPLADNLYAEYLAELNREGLL